MFPVKLNPGEGTDQEEGLPLSCVSIQASQDQLLPACSSLPSPRPLAHLRFVFPELSLEAGGILSALSLRSESVIPPPTSSTQPLESSERRLRRIPLCCSLLYLGFQVFQCFLIREGKHTYLLTHEKMLLISLRGLSLAAKVVASTRYLGHFYRMAQSCWIHRKSCM